MGQLLLRFVVGGAIVSLFAVAGDMLQPKSLAGLLGAAPSVALATLGLVLLRQGGGAAAVEARSMLLASVAFLIYAVAACRLLLSSKPRSVWVAAYLPIGLWLAIAAGAWAWVLR